MSRGTKIVISFLAGAGLATGVRLATDAWKKRVIQQQEEQSEESE